MRMCSECGGGVTKSQERFIEEDGHGRTIVAHKVCPAPVHDPYKHRSAEWVQLRNELVEQRSQMVQRSSMIRDCIERGQVHDIRTHVNRMRDICDRMDALCVNGSPLDVD